MKELKKVVECFRDGIGTIKKKYFINHKGQMHGAFKSWYYQEHLCVDCTYENGKFHGMYKNWWYNEKTCYIIQYKKGNTTGIEIVFNYW